MEEKAIMTIKSHKKIKRIRITRSYSRDLPVLPQRTTIINPRCQSLAIQKVILGINLLLQLLMKNG
jgi:hypothetical protein